MSETMKAIVNYEYGPPNVLEIQEIDKPVIEDNEVMIKTYSASVNTIDIFFRRGIKVFFGLTRLITGIRKPKRRVLGFDFAGEVIEIGKNVTTVKIGDQVYGGSRSGSNAEFMKSHESNIAIKPKNMDYSEAAAIPVAGLSALQGLRDAGEIKKGQKILIYGAAGGIGTYAVQLAKHFKTNVTAVSSGKNKDTVTKLGADYFIDYKKIDFTTLPETYDLIFDAVGKLPLSKWKKSLNENGIFVNAGAPSMGIMRFYFRVLGNKFRKKQIRTFDTKYIKSDLEFFTKICEEGKIKSVIDCTFSFEETAKAHEYYEKGRTVGKVIVKIRDPVLQ